MRFDLVRPCPKCPFRQDCLKGWLGKERAEEIASSILDGGVTFACHETTTFDEEGDHVPDRSEQHCAGALQLILAEDAPHQMTRIAERLGILDWEKLDDATKELVFDSREEFVDHHTYNPDEGRSSRCNSVE